MSGTAVQWYLHLQAKFPVRGRKAYLALIKTKTAGVHESVQGPLIACDMLRDPGYQINGRLSTKSGQGILPSGSGRAVDVFNERRTGTDTGVSLGLLCTLNGVLCNPWLPTKLTDEKQQAEARPSIPSERQCQIVRLTTSM